MKSECYRLAQWACFVNSGRLRIHIYILALMAIYLRQQVKTPENQYWKWAVSTLGHYDLQPYIFDMAWCSQRIPSPYLKWLYRAFYGYNVLICDSSSMLMCHYVTLYTHFTTWGSTLWAIYNIISVPICRATKNFVWKEGKIVILCSHCLHLMRLIGWQKNR